jgi:hypothetical protein
MAAPTKCFGDQGALVRVCQASSRIEASEGFSRDPQFLLAAFNSKWKYESLNSLEFNLSCV